MTAKPRATRRWAFFESKAKPWSEAQFAQAIALRRLGISYKEIGRRVLGVAETTARDRIVALIEQEGLQGLPVSAPPPKRTAERKSPEALDERDRRYEALARRNLSQAFFGDPPPGYSALSGKVGMT